MIDKHLFVIIGGTGDLARRKLLPSLYRLVTERGIADQAIVLGVGTSNLTEKEFRDDARTALVESGLTADQLGSWCDDIIFYHRISREPDAYEQLAKRIHELESEQGLPGNRAFYLALPPQIFPTAIEGLGNAGLNGGPGWCRLVIEKPFGHDLESAHELNELVHRHFDESQVYRIDHYLGKETVQNLLVLRLANPFFERAWNRDHIDQVQVTVAEDIGIGSRSRFYESAGATRDIVQNHLAQVLSLVAMEAPVAFNADEVRNEKLRVLRSIRPIEQDDVVFGQYGAGNIGSARVPAYRDEEGVDHESSTETYVAMRLHMDTWRWQGVPFYLRTGKRLPQRLTEIRITFRPPPVCFFHGEDDQCTAEPNVLVVTLQPDEGFDFKFDMKAPGEDMRVEGQSLRFRHDEVFEPLPDAYQTLLYDIMEGDQTLFVRSDEVEASWSLFDPLLADPPEIHMYPAGTWGPEAADRLVSPAGHEWRVG